MALKDLDLQKTQKIRSKFIEEILESEPEKLVLTELGTCLGDFISAYTRMKIEGDMPPKNGVILGNYQTCLFVVYSERSIINLKCVN